MDKRVKKKFPVEVEIKHFGKKPNSKEYLEFPVGTTTTEIIAMLKAISAKCAWKSFRIGVSDRWGQWHDFNE